MKAMVYNNYGSPSQLEYREIEQPAPKDDEILVQVRATSLNAADWHLLRGNPFLVRLMYGLFKPNNPVLGSDVAGIVQAVGKDVQQFRVGDAVFADLSSSTRGGFAEFVSAKASWFVHKPSNLDFVQAAAVPMAALTALQALQKGGMAQGKRVLIIGASGGVGTFAVQLAKHFGAHVTAVCSTQKLEQTKRLGADEVLDYKQTDVIRHGGQYDLILDIAATRGFPEYSPLLKARGMYVLVGGAFPRFLQLMLLGGLYAQVQGKQFVSLFAQPNTKDLQTLKALLEQEKIVPILEKTYDLQALPEAMTYLGSGRAAGKLVVTL
jgi:NADPH:quinone reductase-like Zn-dependent oxidoreductase